MTAPQMGKFFSETPGMRSTTQKAQGRSGRGEINIKMVRCTVDCGILLDKTSLSLWRDYDKRNFF